MLSDFEKRIMQCEKCPLIVKSRKRIVPGYGDPKAEILFVGLAPGRNGADLTGVPFTKDPSGILFQEALIKAGFSLEKTQKIWKPKLKNIYVTNIVKCNPKDTKGNNRTPSKEEIDNCLPYFEMEKSLIKPKVIAPLGKIATECVLNRKISNFCQLHNTAVSEGGIIYIPLIHPSYVIRGAYSREKYFHEIMSLKEYVQS